MGGGGGGGGTVAGRFQTEKGLAVDTGGSGGGGGVGGARSVENLVMGLGTDCRVVEVVCLTDDACLWNTVTGSGDLRRGDLRRGDLLRCTRGL